MAGQVFTRWWSKMRPYYTDTYKELWVGLGIMGYFYYKLSYGSKLKTYVERNL